MDKKPLQGPKVPEHPVRGPIDIPGSDTKFTIPGYFHNSGLKEYKSTVNRYQPLFEEWTEDDEKVYEAFKEFVIASHYGELYLEWKLPSFIRDKVEFVKELALRTGYDIKDLFKMFLEKHVFQFFSMIRWNFEYLFKLMKDGYHAYKDFMQAVHDFIDKQGIVQWTKEHLLELDDWLKKHPKTRRISGVLLAGLLVYMWMTMSFIGNPSYDFDISMIIDTLRGHMHIADVFGGATGTVFLSLFMSGLIFDLTFPWPGSNIVKFMIAVLVTLAKKLRLHLHHTNRREDAIDAEIAEVT